MCHHSITRVLYVSLVGFVITTGLVLGIYSQAMPAQAFGFIPYGGKVLSVVINPTNPACPIYSVVENSDPFSGPSIFGVHMPPTSLNLTYDYNGLYIPGTWLLGGYEPVPDLSCGPGIPVFPLYPDGLFFLTGTSMF